MRRTDVAAAAAAAALLLLLVGSTAHCAAEEQTAQPCSIYSAECVTNSPRLIKVQHSPKSESYSYFYQVPRRLRKVVRTKMLAANATEPAAEAEMVTPKPAATTRAPPPPPETTRPDRHRRPAGHDGERELFDHVQLTPVFGQRLRARRNTTAAAAATQSEAELEPEARRSAEEEPRPSEREARPSPQEEPRPSEREARRSEEARLSEAEVRPNTVARRRWPARRRRLRRPAAAAAAADADLTEQANALEAATRHGSDRSDERAFRVQRLKRRRKIMAKKLERKQFLGAAPRKKIVKVVAVRKPPRVIPGLSEVYQDNLVNSLISEEYPSLQPSPGIKGFPGVDYPIYQRIPETSFSCSHQRYWGMYADTETQCQVWHYCDQDGNKHSFLCPNGTIFSQVTFICDWWFNVDCNNAVQLYVTNEALSLLPAPPEKTFPEDFNGPIVDWYIYQRHQERSYRKEKFLRKLEAGEHQEAIRFLETHDFPPWFTPRDQALYLKLKGLERKSKNHEPAPHRPVKKELTQYAPRYARTAI